MRYFVPKARLRPNLYTVLFLCILKMCQASGTNTHAAPRKSAILARNLILQYQVTGEYNHQLEKPLSEKWSSAANRSHARMQFLAISVDIL
jgi:hypothetical protein